MRLLQIVETETQSLIWPAEIRVKRLNCTISIKPADDESGWMLETSSSFCSELHPNARQQRRQSEPRCPNTDSWPTDRTWTRATPVLRWPRCKCCCRGDQRYPSVFHYRVVARSQTACNPNALSDCAAICRLAVSTAYNNAITAAPERPGVSTIVIAVAILWLPACPNEPH